MAGADACRWVCRGRRPCFSTTCVPDAFRTHHLTVVEACTTGRRRLAMLRQPPLVMRMLCVLLFFMSLFVCRGRGRHAGRRD